MSSIKYYERSFKLFGIPVWSHHYGGKILWFRLFGRGYLLKHTSEGLTFSQRFGHTKFRRVGNWIISKLDKSKVC